MRTFKNKVKANLPRFFYYLIVQMTRNNTIFTSPVFTGKLTPIYKEGNDK